MITKWCATYATVILVRVWNRKTEQKRVVKHTNHVLFFFFLKYQYHDSSCFWVHNTRTFGSINQKRFLAIKLWCCCGYSDVVFVLIICHFSVNSLFKSITNIGHRIADTEYESCHKHSTHKTHANTSVS